MVDTSALVSLERAHAQWDQLLEEHHAEVIAIPAAAFAELLVGVHLSRGRRSQAKRASIEAFVERAALVPFGREIAERWAELFAALRGRGQLIPANDIAVAAMALHLGFHLIVGEEDEAHFRQVPGLGVDVLTV